MRAIPQIFLGVFLLCVVGSVRAEVIAPDTLIQNTVQEVLAVVKQDKEIQSGNQAKILVLVDAKVLPHFDFLRMTRLSVGKYWRTASEDQKQALVKEFRTMLVRTYTKAFTSYRDQTIDVKPVKMAADDTEVTVKTSILKPGAPSVSVNYEMEKTSDGWKVFDLSIEGAGLVPTYRSTFAKQIEDGGIDGLIKTLADKNANSAATKAATN